MLQNILVVEIDLAIRHPLAEYLRECGYKVLEAVDTDEALTLLKREDVTVDAVLVDVASKGALDGFGLAKWVREHVPGTEVILAGTIEKVTQEAGELCREGPAVSRPYHHQQLLEEIRRRLAARERKS